VKVRAAASSTVVAVLLALSTYGVRLDTAIHHLINGMTSGRAEVKPVALTNAADYDSSLAPLYSAADATLPPAVGLAGGSMRLTLAVADGQTLAGVLAAADVPVADAQAAMDATRRIYDPRKLKAGQFVTINFTGAGGPFGGFELQADAERSVKVVRQADGFAASEARIPLRSETHAARGVIRNSLFESAAEAGIPYPVTAAMIHAFQDDIDFQREIQPGDRFEIMYDTMVGESGGRPGNLLYAELTLSGTQHAIYGFRRDDGTVDFYTRDGKSVRKGLLRTPVDGARLSSGFGMRLHPILGYTRMHKGVDFAVPTGTPIYAAGDGTVEMSGWAGGYGRYVRIRHNTVMETAYGHMSRIAPSTIIGQHVHQGQVIGYVGMTGEATGPHLHFEMIRNGVQVNPASVTIPVSTGLEGSELVAFRQSIADRDQRFAALINGVQFAASHAP
jgi:murein DD-endopeptidase MepM/ murein hydrolase activator NlpD